ncbi:MAG: hypothetical protein ACW98I_19160 [Candidatus Hodarchaeales archaeon]
MPSEEKIQWREKEEETEKQKEERIEKLDEIEETLLAMEPFNDHIVVYDEKVDETKIFQEIKGKIDSLAEDIEEEKEAKQIVQVEKQDTTEAEERLKRIDELEEVLLKQEKYSNHKIIWEDEAQKERVEGIKEIENFHLSNDQELFLNFTESKRQESRNKLKTISKYINNKEIREISISSSLSQNTKVFESFRIDYMSKFNSSMADWEKNNTKPSDKLLYEYSKLSKYLLKDCFILQKKNDDYFYLEDCYEILKEIKELTVGEIGYGKVGRTGKDRHYTLVKDIEENMVFKEIEGKTYARWRKPLRKYTRTDGSAVPEMFFWLFDRVILNVYDYNGNYKLARKIRSTFRKERLEGRDYFILKKDFSFVKKVIQAKYHELDRINEIDRFRNMSRKALTNCLEASMKGKEGGYTTGGLSIPIMASFEVYYVDGKKLWIEVFRAFNDQYENLYDIPKSTLWNKAQELELKLMEPLQLEGKHISFDTTTLRDNFYTLEDGKTFITKNNINSAWYEPCSNNWMFKSCEYIFENLNNRRALHENKLIESVGNSEKKVFSVSNNAAGTDIDRAIDGWTYSLGNISPFELFEIKEVGSRPGGSDDHVRDVIKTVGWVFIGNNEEIRNSIAYKINFLHE